MFHFHETSVACVMFDLIEQGTPTVNLAKITYHILLKLDEDCGFKGILLKLHCHRFQVLLHGHCDTYGYANKSVKYPNRNNSPGLVVFEIHPFRDFASIHRQ